MDSNGAISTLLTQHIPGAQNHLQTAPRPRLAQASKTRGSREPLGSARLVTPSHFALSVHSVRPQPEFVLPRSEEKPEATPAERRHEQEGTPQLPPPPKQETWVLWLVRSAEPQSAYPKHLSPRSPTKEVTRERTEPTLPLASCRTGQALETLLNRGLGPAGAWDMVHLSGHISMLSVTLQMEMTDLPLLFHLSCQIRLQPCSHDRHPSHTHRRLLATGLTACIPQPEVPTCSGSLGGLLHPQQSGVFPPRPANPCVPCLAG
ncbi:uncharacterized protein LOC134387512 [Cynocephalus volans]|uniref:uncharacterized protein LOC134387512 n=1 Tax=Cynocephalus volans TaxID=110931 RepID=UPI002FCCA37C